MGELSCPGGIVTLTSYIISDLKDSGDLMENRFLKLLCYKKYFPWEGLFLIHMYRLLKNAEEKSGLA